MKITRFFGPNTRDVMRQVREALGPDALIVSNRSVEGGIEVLATADDAYEDAPAQTPPRQAPAYAQPAQERQPASSPFGAPAPGDRPQSAPAMPAAGMPPATMAPAAYVAPSRSIAAYQSAFAASARPVGESSDPAGYAPDAETQPAPSLAARPAMPPGVPAMPAAPAPQPVAPAMSTPAASAASVRMAGAAMPAAPMPGAPVRVELPALPPARPSMGAAGFGFASAGSSGAGSSNLGSTAGIGSTGIGGAALRPTPAPMPAAAASAVPVPAAAAAAPTPGVRMNAEPAPAMHMAAATSAPAAHMAAAHMATAHVAAPTATGYQTPQAYAPSTPATHAPQAYAPSTPATHTPAAPVAPQPPAAPSMARTPDAPVRQLPAMPPSNLPADTAAGLQDAISALRGALESRMDGLLWGGRQGPGREPAGAALFRSLLDAGFSTKLVRTLVERLPQGLSTEAALSWARNELVTHLPVVRSEDEFLAGGVYALVGPTGVGKTTTLAKLAARCVAREGREQVAMLTTDLFRIGALEQLQIYGRLMGVPAHSVRDAGELRRILAELGNRKIVLIDTTGISQRDRLVAEQAAMLCNAGKPVRRLLVLNAASQGDTLDEVAHAYRNGVGEDVAGCIITKLDEATRLGAALDTAIRHRLPIHYMSVGQKVPEHMELARADVLIDRAFSMVERARALYTPSEADLASLVSSSREPEAVDPARRRQLLASAILPTQGGAASIAAAQSLDDTISWLDSDAACLQARTAWREYVSDGAGSSLGALGDEPLAMARREFSAACSKNLLVMHGKTTMKGEALPGGSLLSALLMSDRGAALAAPAQQLVLPHGMLSSFAPGAPAQPDPVQALEARVRWLSDRLQAVPLVHMLEAGTVALWQSFTDQGVSWVARCPGGLRVIQDECPTNLNAVGKSVGYLPVGQPGDMPGLRHVKDGKTVPLALWASGTEVALPGKGQGASVRLICARLIDTVSGEVAGQLFGTTNLSASQADAATIARWLVLQDEAKAAFRYMANAWQALPAVDGAHTLARQSLMAGQLGAACWQLAHSPAADVARGPMSGIVGSERKLSGRMLPVALLKMFAMLEMTGGA